MSRSKDMNFDKGKRIRGYILAAAALTLLLILTKNPAIVQASTVPAKTKVDYKVDYLEETITVSRGPGNSDQFYISLDKGRNWESLPSVVVSDAKVGQIDISAILSTKEVSVLLKGNKDTEEISCTLMKEPDDLKVTYDAVGGQITFSGSSAAEYRKGSNGIWKTAVNPLKTAVYEVKGATLYYRTAATASTRAGKIIKVKIPKRPAPPAVKLDGGKLIFSGFKANETQYRLNGSSEWNYFSSDPKVKSISFATLLKQTYEYNVPIPAFGIELRTVATPKKAASGERLMEVLQQPVCPDTVTLTGTTLLITDTVKRNYEYTIVENGKKLDLTAAKWTGISPDKSVVIKKAAVNDKVYIRLKSTVDSSTKQVIPASTCKEFTISSISPKK